MADNMNIQNTELAAEMDNAPAMRSRKPVAVIIFLILFALVIAAGAISTRVHTQGTEIYGELEWNGIRMTVDQSAEGAIRVKVSNRSSEDMNFGWVDKSTVILKTSEGSYIRKIRREIGDRSDGYIFLVFSDASGIPESLTFNSVGTGLGANESVRMQLAGDAIRSMNVFETAWAYVRLAYYWMISASDTQGYILRAVVGAAAIAVLVLLLSLLKSRKAVRARVVKKFIRTTTHYQNGMCTGTSKSYYIVFQLENGKEKKVNVRFRHNYDRIDAAGWGLLTMKGVLFVSFDYLPCI